MSKKMTKDEAKRPDAVTVELKKGFEWSAKHLKLVIGLSVLFVVIGAGVTLAKQYAAKKEAEIQEKYFSVEKQYLDKKQAFDSAEAQAASKQEAEKAAKNDKNGKNKKKADEPAPAPSAESLPSGDLVKDYGPIVEGFKNVVAANKTSKGAQMAALHLSEIYSRYKKMDESIEVLKSVDTGSKDFVGGLVKVQLGNALAEKQDCKQAIATWDAALSNKDNEFLKPALSLKKAICYETLNDKAKAEELYNLVKSSDKSAKNEMGGSSPLAKTADKYLRLLKSKSN